MRPFKVGLAQSAANNKRSSTPGVHGSAAAAACHAHGRQRTPTAEGAEDTHPAAGHTGGREVKWARVLGLHYSRVSRQERRGLRPEGGGGSAHDGPADASPAGVDVFPEYGVPSPWNRQFGTVGFGGGWRNAPDLTLSKTVALRVLRAEFSIFLPATIKI